MGNEIQPISRVDHWIYHWDNPHLTSEKKPKRNQEKFQKALNKAIQECYNTSKVKEQERR